MGGRGKEPEAALRLKAECRQAGDRNGAEGQQEGASLSLIHISGQDVLKAQVVLLIEEDAGVLAA